MKYLIGSVLGSRYEIIEKIGTGGMANVYKARCKVLNRFVAIKILKEEYKNEKEFLDRFRTEGRAVALLSHPNIVTVYDVGVEDELPYLVMELIEGITMKQYIEQKGCLTPKEIIHFIYQILKGIEHAHSKNIIHRDIKPQNILLLRDGSIKVADFGIARFTLSNTKTMTDTAIGSVHYISPEQAKGSVSDGRTDIYSLGVMMYEMLTGKLPFNGENPVAVAIMHLRGDFIKPSEINPQVNKGLEQIALKAMCREPSLRYQTADEMLVDLERFKKNPTISFDHQYDYSGDNGTTHFKTTSGADMRKIYDDEYEDAKERQAVYGKPNVQQKQVKKQTENQTDNQQSGAFLALKIIAIFVGIALIIGIGVYAISRLNGQLDEVIDPTESTQDTLIPVPKIEGLFYEKVLENQIYKDFDIQFNGDAYSETIAEGKIVSQNPASGEQVEKGSVIQVTVSSGAETFELMDLTGVTYETAEAKLKEYGASAIRVDQHHNDIPVGYVIATSPQKGDKVKKGATVKVSVSLGKAVVKKKTPNVVGKNQEEALTELRENGFVVKETKLVESDQPKGTVTYQSIEPGIEIEQNAEITIEVSSGRKPSAYDYYIILPADPVEFNVKVLVNGAVQYEKVHSASERNITITLEIAGSAQVSVYFDGILSETNSKNVVVN